MTRCHKRSLLWFVSVCQHDPDFFLIVRVCVESNITIFTHLIYSSAVICHTINSAESAKTAHTSRVTRQNVTRLDSFKGTNLYNCNAETGCSFQMDHSSVWQYSDAMKSITTLLIRAELAVATVFLAHWCHQLLLDIKIVTATENYLIIRQSDALIWSKS